MARLRLFIDYQNTYKGAREAFHGWDDVSTAGQISPLALGRLITERDIHDHELAGVHVYRGRPDSLKDSKGYGANLKQCSAWEAEAPDIVEVVWRTLRYPRNWPEEKAEEKGIDVALAIDVVRMAVRGEYDVGVVMSTDTDLKPALEAVMEIGGRPYPRVAVAAWSSPDRHSRRLSISGHHLWCYWLDERDYAEVADTTNYLL